MLENNLENKANFLAQYWGQKVFSTGLKGTCAKVSGFVINNCIDEKTGYLKLKPPSCITDEDAIEIVKIIKSFGVASTAMKNPKEYCISSIGKSLFELSQVVDYLRSKGYALPWIAKANYAYHDWLYSCSKKELI